MPCLPKLPSRRRLNTRVTRTFPPLLNFLEISEFCGGGAGVPRHLVLGQNPTRNQRANFSQSARKDMSFGPAKSSEWGPFHASHAPVLRRINQAFAGARRR